MQGGIPVAQDKVYGCVNMLVNNGTEIVEKHSSACGAVDCRVRYVFAKHPSRQEYRFVGVFKKNYEKSDDETAVYDLISDELDLSRWL